MKNLFSIIVVLMIGFSLFAGGNCQDPAKAEAYKKYAADYEKRAKLAEEKGKSKLAAVYRKCAAAKLKISRAFETGNDGLLKIACKEYAKVRKERDALTHPAPAKKKPAAIGWKKVSSKKKPAEVKKDSKKVKSKAKPKPKAKAADGWDGELK